MPGTRGGWEGEWVKKGKTSGKAAVFAQKGGRLGYAKRNYGRCPGAVTYSLPRRASSWETLAKKKQEPTVYETSTKLRIQPRGTLGNNQTECQHTDGGEKPPYRLG